MNAKARVPGWMRDAASVLMAMLSFALAMESASGQRVVRLLEYTNFWRFNDTGTDPGASWMMPGFDDSGWASGLGPFGVEPDLPSPYPLRATPLVLGSPATRAHFFRTHFWFDPTNTAPAQHLEADLFVDDGCLVFLNGVEVVRLRVPVGATFITFANGFNLYEGENELATFGASPLVAGENILAVAVHQLTSTSSDIFFGMRLRTVAPEPLVITRQPEDKAAASGSNVTFAVTVSGGPVAYQWLKNGQPIGGATGSSLTFLANSTQTGRYSVVVSNALGAIESHSAVLSLVPAQADLNGPRVLYAERGPDSMFYNVANVYFDEPLLLTSVRTNNFRITLWDGSGAVPVVATTGIATHSASIAVPSGLLLPGTDYLITVNNVRDRSPSQNIIAPDTQIPITYPVTNFTVGATQTWRFHAALLDDPSIIEADWYSTNFVENLWWQSGLPPFHAGVPAPPCTAATGSSVLFQRQPTLFRTTFQWPTNRGSTAALSLRYAVDDAMVMYLNGVEWFRVGLPPAPAILDVNTRAVASPAPCAALMLTATNLLPGTNWLAAAVYQARHSYMGPIETNLLFDLRLGEVMRAGPVLPPQESPELRLSSLAPDRFRLSWTGPGFALESTTNQHASPDGEFGPWIEVRNMSNPYTNSTTEPFRLYRLRK